MSSLPALYELAAEYRATADKLADLDLDEQTIADTLEGMSGDLEAKAVATVMFARNLEATTAAMKAAEQAMKARREAVEKRADGVRRYVLAAMQKTGIQRIECSHFVISVANNHESVDVFELSTIPAHFMRTPEPPPPAPDKAAIKEAIKAGQDVPGARLTRTQRLSVK